MGCDIHWYVEVRGDDGQWHMHGDPPGLADHDTLDGELSEWDTWGAQPYVYSGRWYALFGYLAGVRGQWLTPISPPRGVPRDASAEYNQIAADWDGDAHSHSWLGLPELLTAEMRDGFESMWDVARAMAELSDNNPLGVRACFFFDN